MLTHQKEPNKMKKKLRDTENHLFIYLCLTHKRFP